MRKTIELVARTTDLSRCEQKIYRRNKSKERGGGGTLDRVGATRGGPVECSQGRSGGERERERERGIGR